MAAGMNRGNRLRPRCRVRKDSGDENVKLDFDREPVTNVKLVLQHVLAQEGVTKQRKLSYLNCFARFLGHSDSKRSLGIGSLELLACLQIGLLNDSREVRAAVLRVLRHLLPLTGMMSAFFLLNVDLLVARSLDTCQDNEVERIHAVRLIRHINVIAPSAMPPSLVCSLVAVGNHGKQFNDNFVVACLLTLCEIALSNIELLTRYNGVPVLMWNLLDTHHTPRLNVTLACTLAYIMNRPHSRRHLTAGLQLAMLLAPFTDHHFVCRIGVAECPKNQHARREDIEARCREERGHHLLAGKTALATLMATWPGLICLCQPKLRSLQSLTGMLAVSDMEVKTHVLGTVSASLCLPVPLWSDDFIASVKSIDPSRLRDSWKLTQGFVVAEGKQLLPHCSSTRPNLVDNHLALVLSIWIKAGLLEALVELLMSSDNALFNQAVILLDNVLHLANQLLPIGLHHHLHCLPQLIEAASFAQSGDQRAQRACLAVRRLDGLHSFRKPGPISCSPFLNQLLRNAGWDRSVSPHLSPDRRTKNVYSSCLKKQPRDRFQKSDDQNYYRFLCRVVEFFRPTNPLFRSVSLSSSLIPNLCNVCCHLVDILVTASQVDVTRAAMGLLLDINVCLVEVVSGEASPDTVFGFDSLNGTASMFYFLMIGRFSTTTTGCYYLEKSGVFQCLLDIMRPDCSLELCVKLAVSSLDYSVEGPCRAVLSKALTATTENCRIYCTQLLNVLVRAGTPAFLEWGVEFLVTQLYDRAPSVAVVALKAIDEACDIEAILDHLVELRPAVLHLGESGAMFLCRFLSVPAGFQYLSRTGFVARELEHWKNKFNERYVHIVEDLLCATLAGHTDGWLSPVSCSIGLDKDVYLPVHLYGQLAMHEDGMTLLKQEPCLREYMSVVASHSMTEDGDILEMKKALWALHFLKLMLEVNASGPSHVLKLWLAGNIGSSFYGIQWLTEEEAVFSSIIHLAEKSSVLSIRGTAFYILGLCACTRYGMERLARYRWESNCRTRRERWPVLDDDRYCHYDILHGADRPANCDGELGMDAVSVVHDELREPGFSPPDGFTDLSRIREESQIVGPDVESTDCLSGSSADVEGVGSRSCLSLLGTVDFKDGCSDVGGHHGRSTVGGSRLSLVPPVPNVSQRKTVLPDTVPGAGNALSLPRFPAVELISVDSSGLSETEGNLLVSFRRDTDDGTDVVHPRDISLTVISRESADDDDGQESRACGMPNAATPYLSLECGCPCPSNDIRGHGPGNFVVGGDSFHVDSDVVECSPIGTKRTPGGGDDSPRPEKGRADSFNADSNTTSGVSSLDSASRPLPTASAVSLSPVPPPSSFTVTFPAPPFRPALRLDDGECDCESNAGGVEMRDGASLGSGGRFKRAERTWSVRHPPSHLATASEPTDPIGRSSSGWSDVSGYNALKRITSRRRRALSTNSECVVGEAGRRMRSQTDVGWDPHARRSSNVQSEDSSDVSTVDSSVWLSIRRNISTGSLNQRDKHSILQHSRLRMFTPLSCHSRFVGIALPVDTDMMLEVDPAGETTQPVDSLSDEQLPDTTCSVFFNTPPPPSSSKDHPPTLHHHRDGCIVCSIRRRCFRADNSTDCHAVEVVAGSESDHNMRLAILHLVTNLASSVGFRASEQGLLSLKHRVPSVFRDLCFYSDVCQLLSHLHYQLGARRFIHELFDDLDITKLLQGPYNFLGMILCDHRHLTSRRHDDDLSDTFADFS